MKVIDSFVLWYFLWFASLSLWKHQKLFKKKSGEAELDLKVSIFGTRHAMSFMPITSYRREICIGACVI